MNSSKPLKIHQNKKMLIDKYILTVTKKSGEGIVNTKFMCSICNDEFQRSGIAEGHVFMKHVLTNDFNGQVSQEDDLSTNDHSNGLTKEASREIKKTLLCERDDKKTLLGEPKDITCLVICLSRIVKMSRTVNQ